MNEYKAGRELDALIAEKVMGLHPRWGTAYKTKERYPYTGLYPKTPVLHYSTDIAAVWQVVEKILNMGKFCRHLEIEECDGRWFAGFAENGDYPNAISADTAPLAICLAALKAVGEIVGA